MSAENSPQSYEIRPIGYVRRTENVRQLEILEPYRPGLRQLDHFGHVIVLWWASQYDNPESRARVQCRPPYAEDKLTGVFASRSEYRPNPIALTTSKILEVDEESGVVRLGDIDAFDGTPVLDLKGYFPVCDRVQETHIPDWIPFDYPWMPDEGLGLYEDQE